MNRGSLPIRVQESDEAGRARIVKVWKHFGFKASITDEAGKTDQVFESIWIFIHREGAGRCSNQFPRSPISRFR